MVPYLIAGSLFIHTDTVYWGAFLTTFVKGSVGEHRLSGIKTPHLMPKSQLLHTVICYGQPGEMQRHKILASLSGYSGGKK